MMIKRSRPIGLGLLLFFLLLPQSPLIAQRLSTQDIAGSWATFSSNGFTPRGAFTTQEVGGKIYVIGGFTGLDYITTIQVYDPATNTWDSIPNAAGTFTPRRGMSSVVIGGKIYTFGGANGTGGSNGSGALNTVEVFDPETNTWSTPAMTDSMTSRWRSCAVLLGDSVYVIGGYNSSAGGPVNNVDIFNTLTSTWSLGDTVSFGARSDFAAFPINGKIYVVGGQGDTISPQVFDPDLNKWITPATFGSYVERQGVSAAVINGEIYCFGGTNGEYLSTIDVFDPATNSWTTPPTSGVSIARAGGCATLYNGKVYIMGGRDDWGQLDTNSVFIPAISGVSQTQHFSSISLFPNPTDGMVTIQTMPTANSSHLIVMNILGQILIDKIIEPGSGNISLDLSKFESGVYRAQIATDNAMFGQSIVKR
jgi:N-acetylneuraminic acid mutarotase